MQDNHKKYEKLLEEHILALRELLGITKSEREARIAETDKLRQQIDKYHTQFHEVRERSANAILQRNKVLTTLLQQQKKGNTEFFAEVEKLMIIDNHDDLVFRLLDMIEDWHAQDKLL